MWEDDPKWNCWLLERVSECSNIKFDLGNEFLMPNNLSIDIQHVNMWEDDP